jgi:T-complex protein 1 subunit eta
LISNINACEAIVDVVRTTLGPCGMDKLIYTGSSTTVSNDGATVLKGLDIVHPAAKTLVDIARSQDSEVRHGPFFFSLLRSSLLRIQTGRCVPTFPIAFFRKSADTFSC